MEIIIIKKDGVACFYLGQYSPATDHKGPNVWLVKSNHKLEHCGKWVKTPLINDDIAETVRNHVGGEIIKIETL